MCLLCIVFANWKVKIIPLEILVSISYCWCLRNLEDEPWQCKSRDRMTKEEAVYLEETRNGCGWIRVPALEMIIHNLQWLRTTTKVNPNSFLGLSGIAWPVHSAFSNLTCDQAASTITSSLILHSLSSFLCQCLFHFSNLHSLPQSDLHRPPGESTPTHGFLCIRPPCLS